MPEKMLPRYSISNVESRIDCQKNFVHFIS